MKGCIMVGLLLVVHEYAFKLRDVLNLMVVGER